MHVRPQDPEAWRRLYPEHRPGAPFPFKCPGCWLPLTPGCKVKVRSVPRGLEDQLALGDFGIVTAVEGEDDAAVYTVEVDPQCGERLAARFTRRELTWQGRP